MEVFRGLGGLAESVKQQSPPLELWRKFVYCESLTGHILGSVDHFKVALPLTLCCCNSRLGNLILYQFQLQPLKRCIQQFYRVSSPFYLHRVKRRHTQRMSALSR